MLPDILKSARQRPLPWSPLRKYFCPARRIAAPHGHSLASIPLGTILRSGLTPRPRYRHVLRPIEEPGRRPLSGPHLLQKPAKRPLGCETHGSIRIQEGEPFCCARPTSNRSRELELSFGR